MSRYTARDFNASLNNDSYNYGAEAPAAGQRLRRLLDTPSPGTGMGMRTAKTTSKESEFTPILHTVRRETGGKETPPIVKPIQTKSRPKSLLRYSNEEPDSMMSLNNTSSFSAIDNQNTPVPKSGSGPGLARQRAMVAEDPTSLPLREQARHMDSLEKENMDLKLKLQLLQKRLVTISHSSGDKLTDITNTASPTEETYDWMKKYADMEQKYFQSRDQLTDLEYDFNRRIHELQEDLDAREAENTSYAEKIDQYEARIDELNELNEQLQDKLSGTADKSDSDEPNNTKQLKELNDRITDLEYQNRSLEEDLERLEAENGQLKDEVVELHEQNKSHNDSYEAQEALDEEKEQLISEKEDLRQKLLSAEDDLEYGKKNETQLRNRLEEAREEIKRLKEEVEATVHNSYVSPGKHQDKGSASFMSKELDLLKDAKERLENEVDNLTAVNSQLKKDAATYRQEVDSLKKDIITANSLAKRLQKESEGYKREAEYMQEQHTKVKDELMDITRAANESVLVRNNELEIDRLRDEVDSKQETIKQLTERWDSDKKVLNDKIRALERMKDAAERQVNMLMSKQNTSHIKSIVDSEKEKSQKLKDTLSAEIDHLKKQLADIKEERDAIDRKYNSLKTDFANESMQETQTLKNNNELRNLIEKLEADVFKHQREALKLTATVEEYKINLDMVRELREVDTQKISDLGKQLEQVTSELEAAKRASQEAQTEAKRLQTKLEQADDKINESERTRVDIEEEAVSELEVLQAKLERARVENNRLDSLLADAQFQSDEYKSEVRDLKRQLRSAESQLDKLSRKLYGRQEDVNFSKTQNNDKAQYYKDRLNNERVAEQLRRKVMELERDAAVSARNAEESIRPRSQGSKPTNNEIEVEEKYRNLWNAYVYYVQFNKLHLRRELELKHDLEFTKDYLMAKSGKFLHSNMKTLEMFANIGLYPDYKKLACEKRTFKGLAYTVIASIRFAKRLQDYREYQQEMKKAQRIRQLII